MLQLIKKIFSLSFLYGFSSISYKLVGLFLLPIYTRYLTPTEFGVYAIALIGIMFFEAFVSMGIPSAFFRFFYDFRDTKQRNELISTTYLFVTFTSLILILFLFSIRGQLLPRLFIREEYYLCFYLTIFLSMMEPPQVIAFHYFRAAEQVKKYCFFNLLRSAVLFFCAWFFLAIMKYGIFSPFIARMISTFPTYLYLSWAIISRHGIRFSSRKFKEMFAFGLPFFVVSLMGIIMSSLDRPILLKYMSMADVGIYSVAFRVASGVKFLIVSAFALGWSPMIMNIKSQQNGPELFSKLFTYYLLVAGAIVLAVSLYAKDILTILVTPRFISAYVVIPLLCLGHLFYGLYHNLEVGIFITKKSKYYIPILGVGSAAYIILNLLLIPKFGYLGAGIASASSFFLIPIVTFLLGRKLYYIRYEYIRICKIFTCLILVYLLGMWVPFQQFPQSLIKNFIILLCFPFLLLAIGFFKKNELIWVTRKITSNFSHS